MPTKNRKGTSAGSDESDSADDLKRHLMAQLAETHVRFAELMESRLEGAETSELERYFGLLSTLVGKLENEDKALRDVMREMAGEYAAIILTELNR